MLEDRLNTEGAVLPLSPHATLASGGAQRSRLLDFCFLATTSVMKRHNNTLCKPIMAPLFALPNELILSSIIARYPCRDQQVRSLATLLSVSAHLP